MKRSAFLILLLLSLSIYSQENVYRSKIDSLKSLKEKNNEQIAILNSKNTRIDDEIETINLKLDSIAVKNSNSEILHSNIRTIFYGDEILEDRIENIPIGTVVGLIEEFDDKYKIRYKDRIGYVKKFAFITDAEHQKNVKAKKDKEEELKRKIEIAKQKEQEYIQEQIEIGKQRALAKEERRKELIKKYGSYNGKLIAEGKVAIGMSQKMVVDSWGKPSDINKDIYSFGVHEQWVFGSGNYVYFKDGIVTSISTSR